MKSWPSQLELGPACAQALLEALPIYALARIVYALAPQAGSIDLAMLAGLAIACASLARLSLRWPLPFVLQRLSLMAAGAGVLLAWLHQVIAPMAAWRPSIWLRAVTEPWRVNLACSGHAVFWAWLAGGYLTCRGLFIGLQREGDVTRWFGAGAIAWVLVLALLARAGLHESELPSDALQALALAYFALGLALSALERQRRVFAREGLRTRATKAFWLAVTLPVGCVAFGALLALQGLQGARQLGANGWLILREAGRWLGRALVLLGYGLQRCLQWLGRFGPVGRSSEAPRAHAHAPELPVGWGFTHRPTPHVDFDALPLVLAAATFLALGLLVAALFRRPPRVGPDALQEQSDSLLSAELLEHDLRALLSGLAARLRRPARPAPQPSAADPTAPITDLRAAYRALLGWAEAQGQTRAPDTTPDEFALQLSNSHPTLQPEIDSLTRCYVAARYGHAPATDAQLAEARRALAKLASGA